MENELSKFTNSNYSTAGYEKSFAGTAKLGTKLKRDTALENDKVFIVDALDIDWGGFNFQYIDEDFSIKKVESNGYAIENGGVGIVSTGYLLKLISDSLTRLGKRIGILTSSYVGGDTLNSVLESIENIKEELTTGNGPDLNTLVDKLKGLGDQTVIQYVQNYIDTRLKLDGPERFLTASEIETLIDRKFTENLSYISNIIDTEINDLRYTTNRLSSSVVANNNNIVSIKKDINQIYKDMGSLESRIGTNSGSNDIDIHYGNQSKGESVNTLYITTNYIDTSKQYYNVSIVIENGRTYGSTNTNVEVGKTASWLVVPRNGYVISKVVNGKTNGGNTITSNQVESEDITVYVYCTELLTHLSYYDESEFISYFRPYTGEGLLNKAGQSLENRQFTTMS